MRNVKYFIYGVVNNKDKQDVVENCCAGTEKIKLTHLYIINVPLFFKYVDSGRVVLQDEKQTGHYIKCKYNDDTKILTCPIKYNNGEKDSSFVSISIEELKKLDDTIVKYTYEHSEEISK